MADIYDHLKELTKLDIIFKDKNNVPYHLTSHIKCLDTDFILIAPPILNGNAYNIPDNSEIKIRICTNEGVYAAECTVIKKEISNTPGLWISYPANSQRYQRREYIRAAINANANITIYKDKSKKEMVKLQEITRDIGGKGFTFLSDSPLNDYYDIECEIHLKDGNDAPIAAKCDHVYSREIFAKGKTKYINALAFVNLSNFDKERIIKACFKYQLEARRKRAGV